MKPSLRDLTLQSFKIGCLGFGGPAGQIALMHRVFVDEKQWIDEARYLHALNYCMVLPGPEAQQLATYVGWLLHGVRGGIIAGTLFVAPGALLMLALSWLYATQAHTALVASLFFGLKSAVLALVAEALIKIARRALKTRFDLALATLAFLALFLGGVPFPLVILAAGVIGFWRARTIEAPHTMAPQPATRAALVAALIWALVWLAPPALVLGLLGPDHVLSRIGVLFSQLALVTFGGAYAVLASLQQEAVSAQGWLAPGQMIDGLGLAETTPGPLILVNQFVGFLAGWQAKGGGMVTALAGAAMATWCTFAPSFLWIFAGAPFAERLRTHTKAAGALAAIMAAVLGVIANLALWFGLHVIFARTIEITLPWGTGLVLPEVQSFNLPAALIAVAAGIALIRFKAHVILVVTASALAGLALNLLG